jgi:hypothetical protein
MNWFKMYHEARNDAKLRLLDDSQFRTWFNLLCYASERAEGGFIDYRDFGLLAIEVSSGDTEKLQNTLIRLQQLRIVVYDEADCSIEFLRFSARQSEMKPSQSPERIRERVARCREKKRSEQGISGHVTPHVTPCNTHETPCNDIRPDQTRPEEIRLDQTRPNSRARNGTQHPVGTSGLVGGGLFEKSVSVLVSEGCTEAEVRAAIADLGEHPTAEPVRYPTAVLRKAIARLREESPVSQAVPPVEKSAEREAREHAEWEAGNERRRAMEAEIEAKMTPQQRADAEATRVKTAEILSLREIAQNGTEEEKRAAQNRIRELITT